MITQSVLQSYPVFIRPVQLADATGLKQTCWADRSLNSIVELLKRTQKLAAQRRGLGAIALRGNVPCAFGLLTLWPHEAEISDLIVSAQHRNRGIGSRIIDYLTGAARNLQVQTLEIGVALSNPRALALYRRLGFSDRRTIELNLGNGPEQVLYLYKNPQDTA